MSLFDQFNSEGGGGMVYGTAAARSTYTDTSTVAYQQDALVSR